MKKESLNENGWTHSLDALTMRLQKEGWTQWEIADMLRKWVEASDSAIGTSPDSTDG